MESNRQAKINELWTKLNTLYGTDDKKAFVTHANMRGGSLHVPDNRKEPFLQLLQYYDKTFQARMSFSERTNSSVRPVFLDLDFSSTDESHLLMQERTYCDITTEVLLPSLYECYGKQKILEAGIEIVVAFPNKKRPKSRVDEKTIVKKFGAHIRCLQKLSNGCVVGGGPYMTVEQFDTLCQVIVYKLSKRYPSISKEIFNDLVDLSPFENGGMRMLRNQKTLTTCKMHTYEQNGKQFDMLDVCDYCNGTSKYIDNSFYQPKFIVNAAGDIESALRWENDLVKMWRETSIVVPWIDLDDLYQNVFDPAQKLAFVPPVGYAPTADISKTIQDAWNETDQDTGMTVRKKKKRKISAAMKKRVPGNNTERLLNKDLKEVMESWIYANFPRFCPAPPNGNLKAYHDDICNFQFQYIHLPDRWLQVAKILGVDETVVQRYWKLLPKVEVQDILRMDKANLCSPIIVKTDGGSPFSNACYNAGETKRSKKGYHCSNGTAYFELKRGQHKTIVGCQRCFANNKKEESASIRKVTCKSFRSTPKTVPEWVAMGLFDIGATVVDPFLTEYCRSDKSAVVAKMRNHLRSTGKFQSLRKMRW